MQHQQTPWIPTRRAPLQCAAVHTAAAPRERREVYNKAPSHDTNKKSPRGVPAPAMAPADDIYVINGFYSSKCSMRRKYAAPGASVYYFSVEWDSSLMSWAEFRGEVLGATDPERASVGSMRWQIMQDWAALGLVAKPDVGDNGVHGSASPFEALVERLNWLGASLDTDETARAIVSAGVSRDRIGERSAHRPLHAAAAAPPAPATLSPHQHPPAAAAERASPQPSRAAPPPHDTHPSRARAPSAPALLPLSGTSHMGAAGGLARRLARRRWGALEGGLDLRGGGWR